MKYLLIISFLFLSCRHQESDTQQVELLEEQIQVAAKYCAELTDEAITKRCDRGTFANLANAFCFGTRPYDLTRHEWAPGEHHRDIKPNTCFPVDSKSECSPDYFITKVHDWITRRDAASLAELDRLLDFLDDNDNKCGEGPNELTKLTHLLPILSFTKSYLKEDPRLTDPTIYDDDDDSAEEALPRSDIAVPGDEDALADLIPTHNQYLLALYIYAKGRLNGSISNTGKGVLKQLVEADPNSPIFLALYYRYHNGDQQRALDSMAADFPKDKLCKSDEYRGWGSAPCAIMQIVATGILSGK